MVVLYALFCVTFKYDRGKEALVTSKVLKSKHFYYLYLQHDDQGHNDMHIVLPYTGWHLK